MDNLIILGSGRSGSSMLTGVLSHAGYFIGENPDYLKKNKANPKGFFEDYEINTINEDILRNNLITIPEPLRNRFFKSFTFYRARWLAILPRCKKLKSSHHIDNRIKAILNRQPFCYKDPRFSYTLPIWNRFLNADTKYLVIFREPNKTAESIVRECCENKGLRRLRMTKQRAFKVWISMYSHILKNYEVSIHKEQWMFFHYDHIFDTQQVSKLEAFTGVQLDKSFADKHLSRTTHNSQKIPEKAQVVYDQLLMLC